MNSQRVGVVGLGLLGRGITACFLGHGFEAVAFARHEQTHTSVREHIEQMMDELVDLGGFDAGIRQSWLARYFPATDYPALRDCSFVVESVVEDIATKHEVFDRIESEVGAAAIIASNSSAIPITQLQKRRQHPERFLAMHWAEPAHATRFLEIIRGEKTSEATIQTTLSLARRLGKEPSLLQKEIPGFIANRIGYAMYREALSLLESGVADAETIDRSMRNALGLWATVCGPLRWMDLTGGPELYAKAIQHVLPTLNNSTELPPVMQKLAGTGARGITNGRGFYSYTPEEARHWEELYRRHAWRVAQMQNEYFPVKDNNPS
jgi:3-hydroxybutyryl-CoA dehydrogenase